MTKKYEEPHSGSSASSDHDGQSGPTISRRGFLITGISLATVAALPALPPARAQGFKNWANEVRRSQNGLLNTQLRTVRASNEIPQWELASITINGNPVQFRRLIGIFPVDTRTYEGTIPGPELRLGRGDVLRIKLINEIPEGSDPIGVPGEPLPGEKGFDVNIPHGFNVTNLHTHGFNVPPTCDPPLEELAPHELPEVCSDNVFPEIRPDEELQYEYEIPNEHPDGTFWYHPHKHGSVAFQMMGGMGGAIIIEGPTDSFLRRRGVRADKTFVIQQVRPRINAATGEREETIEIESFDDFLVPPMYTVNGELNPVIYIPPGEVQRWRFINAGMSEHVPLQLLNGDGVPQPLYQIAADGITLPNPVESKLVFWGNLGFFPVESAIYEMENFFNEVADGVFEVTLDGHAPAGPYGLTRMTGTIWGTIVPSEDDPTKGNGTFSSDPTRFGLTGLEPGFVALSDESGSNGVIATDEATSVVDFATGKVNATGLLKIYAGIGQFAGASGSITISEEGQLDLTPGAPYLAELTLDGFIRIDKDPALGIFMAAGNRADVLIKCDKRGAYQLIKPRFDQGFLEGPVPEVPNPEIPGQEFPIATVICTRWSEENQDLPDDLQSLSLPTPPLKDIEDDELDLTRPDSNQPHRTLIFAIDPTSFGDPLNNIPPPPFPKFVIGGRYTLDAEDNVVENDITLPDGTIIPFDAPLQFDPNRVDQVIKEGAVEEWTIINPSPVDHPFHIHQIAFQVIAINDPRLPPKDPENPDDEQSIIEGTLPRWQDTQNIPGGTIDPETFQPITPGSITIRLRFEAGVFRGIPQSIAGRFVLHCHILDHEDTGMMQLVELVP